MVDGLVDVAYLDLSFAVNGRSIPGQVRNSWIDPQKLVRLDRKRQFKNRRLERCTSRKQAGARTARQRKGAWWLNILIYPDVEPLHLRVRAFLAMSDYR